MSAVNHLHRASAHFTKHKERRGATLSLGFGRIGSFKELGKEIIVERNSRNVSCCIDTEAVHAHFDKASIAINDILAHSRVFGVKVHTVTRDLSPPSRWVVPVEPPFVVPIVVDILVGEIRVFHQRQTRSVLVAGFHRSIIFGKLTALGLRQHLHATDIAKVD